MAQVKVLKDFRYSENESGWARKGEVVELTNPEVLIRIGNVKLLETEPVEEVAEKEEVVTPEVKEKEVTPEVEEKVEEEKAGFVCEVCGKVCKTLAGLKSHMRVHV